MESKCWLMKLSDQKKSEVLNEREKEEMLKEILHEKKFW